MGTDIDTIFKMLSWNSSEKEQLRGIDEAKKIEYLSVLFQPIEDKSVWENCAKVISSKSDNELKKYMQLNSNITLNQNLFDIGLDSLSLISLIIDIENNYKFEFDDSDMVLEKFSTIESIIKLVDSYL